MGKNPLECLSCISETYSFTELVFSLHRFVGATEQAVSVDKSPSKALEECLSWLQEATSNLKGSESLPVSPAYYPFYAQFSKVESDSSQV